jgi:hypothetical protein
MWRQPCAARSLGEGAVFRVIREIQERYFHTPEFAPAGQASPRAEWLTGRLPFAVQPNGPSITIRGTAFAYEGQGALGENDEQQSNERGGGRLALKRYNLVYF